MREAPIRQAVSTLHQSITNVWALWFSDLVRLLNSFTSENSIEITDSDNGVILKSPDGTRWLVQVDNTGTLTTTSL